MQLPLKDWSLQGWIYRVAVAVVLFSGTGVAKHCGTPIDKARNPWPG